MSSDELTPFEILQRVEGDGLVLHQSATGEIRLRVSEYKGVMRLDIRRHFVNEEGKVCPTKSGVALRFESLPSLLQALTAINNRGPSA